MRRKIEPSKFAEEVYQAVKKIPAGTVLTYKQVAEKIGRPKAFRAVGNALNKSPGMKGGVPCHRVIRADGAVGGFAGGTKKKTELLRKEGVLIEDGKVKNL